MNNYVTCELSENGVVRIREIPCSLTISSSCAYILRDKTFLSEYINKYGKYIGLLFRRDTFDYTEEDITMNSGIIAFL